MGNFKIDRSVMKAKGSTSTRTFVGYKIGGRRPTSRFVVGRFGFANPVSATVFSYLNNNTEVTQNAAVLAVEGIETRMNFAGALSVLHGLTLADAVTAVIPYGKMVQVGSKIVTSLGSASMQLRIQNSAASVERTNPYSPKEAMTWTGSMADEYAEYAVAYWKANPGAGPAYIIGP